MNTAETVPQPRFPAVGEASFEAMRTAVWAALAEHGTAGRSVIVWRDGKAVEVRVNEIGAA